MALFWPAARRLVLGHHGHRRGSLHRAPDSRALQTLTGRRIFRKIFATMVGPHCRDWHLSDSWTGFFCVAICLGPNRQRWHASIA